MIHVESKQFAGPMDLLLDLIDQSKIDIYDIEISTITEEFVRAMQTLTISSDELTDFIRMASILVMIKARSLLADQEPEEEEMVTREELIARLLEYRSFKSVCRYFRSIEGNGEGLFRKLGEDLSVFAAEPEEEIMGDAALLQRALLLVLQRWTETEEESFHIDRILNVDEYSLARMQEMIRQRLASGVSFSLEDLLEDCPTKPQVITAFLSLLELTKTGEVHLTQKKGDRSIWVEFEERYDREA